MTTHRVRSDERYLPENGAVAAACDRPKNVVAPLPQRATDLFDPAAPGRGPTT